MDTAALYCCSAEKKEDDLELQEFHDNLDLLALFDITESTDSIKGVKWSKKKQKTPVGLDVGDIFNSGQNVLKFDLSKGASHQRIMSTKGQKFDAKNVQVTKVILNSKSRESNEETVNSAGVENVKNVEQGSSNQKAGGTEEVCEKDVCRKYNENENIKESEHDLGEEESVEVEDETDFDDKDENSDDSVKTDDLYGSNTVLEDQQTDSTEKNTQQSGIKLGTGKIQDVLKIITGFTEDYLLSSGVKSMKVLHEKLKYYSLFHKPVHDKLLCDALPFYMKFSTIGEMFMSD